MDSWPKEPLIYSEVSRHRDVVDAFSFPPTARLLKGTAFKAAFRHGSRFSSRFFLVYAYAGDAPTARLGLAVSRKTDPRAVERNRIKRVVRESFRAARPRLPPFDIVVVARREAAASANAPLREDLRQVWQRVMSLKPAPGNGTMRTASLSTAEKPVS